MRHTTVSVTMSPLKCTCAFLALFSSLALAVDVELMVGFKNIFISAITTNVIFFNEQSLVNNSMAFAACNKYHDNKVLDCDLHLVYPTSVTTAEHVKCPSKYYLEQGKSAHELLLVKPLHNFRLLFKWLVVDKTDASKDPYVLIRIVNMNDCASEDVKVPLGEKPYFHAPALVTYNDTLDVFFRNKSLCGEKMCGESHDAKGRLINGPLPSSLDADLFKKSSFLYSAKPDSPAWGYFLLAAKFYHVDPVNGKTKELMDFPANALTLAFGSEHGYLGVCWADAEDETSANCRQYDGRGEQLLSAKLELGYRLGRTMSVRNRRGGGLLLQTNRCEDDDWCEDHLHRLTFYVHKVEKDGTAKVMHDADAIYCGSTMHVLTNEMPNGDVCLTFGCLSHSFVAQTNVEVRTFIYCVGPRNVTVAAVSTEAPVETKVTKKPAKPTKMKGPRWHI